MNTEASFRPNVKLIIVRRFVSEAKAHIYAAYLRESGIRSFISNGNTGTLIPFVDGGFLMHIAESDKEEALVLLKELDEKSETRLDEDYHDADASDILYEKAVHDYERKIERGEGKYLAWILIAIVMVLAMIFAYLNSKHIQQKTTGQHFLDKTHHVFRVS